MRNLLTLLILSLAVTACSGTRVVLLPDPDGAVGRVEVTTSTGSAVLEQSHAGVTVAAPDAAPGAVEIWDDASVQRTFGEALAAQPAVPAHFDLYFLSDATVLTGVSEEVLPDIVREIQARRSMDISINGHTDRMGDEAYNIDLSLRRAQAVFDKLKAMGVNEEYVDVTSHGEGNPLVPTPDDVPEPRNRRVEVIVR